MSKLHTTWMCLAALAAVSCNDESSPSYSGSVDAAVSCVDLAGDWTIAEHCGAALKGMTVTVTQSECTITTQGAFAGFKGHVATDGTFSMTGSANGTNVACTGTAEAKRISETCTGNCQVVLMR